MTDAATTSNDLVPGGQHDDPNDLRTDDFGLGGDLRKQLTDALTKVWDADDPGATPIPDDTAPPATPSPDDTGSADTAATPAPAPETSPADAQGQQGEDGAGGGRAADDGGGAATQTSPATTPPAPTNAGDATGDDFDLGEFLNGYFGTPLNKEQAQYLAGAFANLQSLSPQQRAELDRVLAGGQPNAYPATMGQAVSHQTAPESLTTPPDDPALAVLGNRPDDDYLGAQWDMNAATIRANSQRLDQIQAEIERNTQAEMQRQAQAHAARIEEAKASWREQHKDLADAEFDGLLKRAELSQTFPGLVAAHHGDITAATNALLEQHYWSDPALRERAIANIASGRQAGDATQVDPANGVAQQQAAVDAGRQQLASSVAGGGGSVTPATATPPTDPDKRKAAMAQEIAANHDFT